MTAFNKSNFFTIDVAKKVHDFSVDSIMLALLDTVPTAAMSLYGNLTGELGTAGGYTTGGFSIRGSIASAAGVAKYTASSYQLTATATIGPFRYAAKYNLSAVSKQLIGWYDYGAEITLATSEQFLYLPDNTAGDWTLT